MNRYKIEIIVDYDDKPEKTYLVIETKDDKRTVGKNIERVKHALNTIVWDDYDSYEEYVEFESKYKNNLLSKEEFETMTNCFMGYNQLTFERYLKEKYGYKTSWISGCCDFKVVID